MTNYRNRGMQLEREIESSNISYQFTRTAVIQKIATPMKKLNDKAVFSEKSTIDFLGILRGRGIAFDAKETTNPTCFPLKNVKEHQQRFLENFRVTGGISFVLVRFVVHQETFILTSMQLAQWWKDMAYGGRKSIPYTWFIENCEQVKSRNGIAIDYLRPFLGGKVTT
ncbi:Holliday junction resolvase RecU [Sporolactobacillus sp. STSJ-5]|uniref:Holliday junction resolvase RecU n=1 Tax=Sporolactobacillus sp. STSJ-5 TaxID=2965076 RepID=UPI0021022EC5|nr:Holliday junction resolvase RecU [Sporolactobacillus sp. STSJ-5]MCQ2009233.1 Holliday junction resolvase RecU [Sporolactobacillus sp. STSJ-5]